MKEIYKLTIGFENMEYANIPREYIRDFDMEGIGRNVRRRAINLISDMQVAEEFAIEISPELNDFEDNGYYFDRSEMDVPDNVNVIQRILDHNDITRVTLHYEDGTEEDIYVRWEDGDNEWTNQYQKSRMKDGVLQVVIAKDKNLDDFFAEDCGIQFGYLV